METNCPLVPTDSGPWSGPGTAAPLNPETLDTDQPRPQNGGCLALAPTSRWCQSPAAADSCPGAAGVADRGETPGPE